MTAFAPLLGLLAEVPDPRRGQGRIYKLPHVLLFSILAIVTGGNSYRGIVTFIDVNRRQLNAAFGLNWRRAPAHTAIRYILKGLDPAAVEPIFRRHAALLPAIRAAKAVRAHWAIETTSHYSRDVTMGEDRSRIRSNPGVFARLRSFAFNILKANRTGTLSQDRYRAALAGVDSLLELIDIS